MAIVTNKSGAPRGFNAYVRGQPTTIELVAGASQDIALIGRDSPVLSAWRAAGEVEIGPVNMTDTAHAPSVSDVVSAAAALNRENEIVSGLKAEVEARTAEAKSLRVEHETLKAQLVADLQAAHAQTTAAQDDLARARAGQHDEVTRLNAQIESLQRTLDAAVKTSTAPPLAPTPSPTPPAPPTPPETPDPPPAIEPGKTTKKG